MNLRQANLNDIPFIKDCLIDSWVEHAKNNPDLMTEERMRKSKIEEYYTDAIENNKGYTFIAEFDNKKVGLIRAYEDKLADFFKDSNILYIDDLYVLKDFRRKGIAKQLLEEIEKIAKKKGIKRIDARVYTYNHPMQQLLNSFEFKPPYATWVKLVE